MPGMLSEALGMIDSKHVTQLDFKKYLAFLHQTSIFSRTFLHLHILEDHLNELIEKFDFSITVSSGAFVVVKMVL